MLFGASKSFTLGLMVYIDDVTNVQYLFKGGSNIFTLIFNPTNNRLYFWVKGGGVQYYMIALNADITTVGWYFLNIIVDGVTPANSEIFVNAASKSVSKNMSTNIDTTLIQLGSTLVGNLSSFGVIDGVQTREKCEEWYHKGKPKNPQTLFGNACKWFFNPDKSGDIAPFIVKDYVNNITVTSVSLVTADKTTNTPY